MLRAVGKIVNSVRVLNAARLVRRFGRHQQGATAVEFALIALPFLALLFAIIETALVFFASQTLENAAAEAGRMVMTGQAQTQNWDAAKFKEKICAPQPQPGQQAAPQTAVNALFDCSQIFVDVRNYSDSFAGVKTAPPVTTDPTTNTTDLDTSKMDFKPGGPRCITVVQIFYRWPIYVSLLNDSLSNLTNWKRLLVATAVFRNEPYASGDCT